MDTDHGPTAPAPADPNGFAVETAQRVDKPWGHEIYFAVVEGLYVGKLLHINAGARLSLQKHTAKDETVSVVSGKIQLQIGETVESCQTLELGPGQSMRVRPGVVHRMIGVEDAVVAEASTAGEDWRNDVIRLEDSYGREGTSAP